MKTAVVFAFCLFFQAFLFLLQSQPLPVKPSSPQPDQNIPYELSTKEWKYVQRVWEKSCYPVTLYPKGGSPGNGQILFRNDSVLILWADSKTFINPYKADSLIKVFNTSFIDSLCGYRYYQFKDKGNGLLWGPLAGLVHGIVMLIVVGGGGALFVLPITIGAGFAIGGVGEIIKASSASAGLQKVPFNFEGLRAHKQKRYIIYPDRLPEWLGNHTISNENKAGILETMAFDDVTNHSPKAKKSFRIPRWHLSPLFGFAIPSYETYEDNKIFGGSLGYKMNRYFLIEYRYLYYEWCWSDWTFNDVTFVQQYTKQGQTFSAQFIAFQPDRYLRNRFEFNLGIGISTNKIRYSDSGTDFSDNLAGLGLISGLGPIFKSQLINPY